MQGILRHSFRPREIRGIGSVKPISAIARPSLIFFQASIRMPSCIWRRKVSRPSIDSPADFIDTNMVGTYVLLEAALSYWRKLDRGAPKISLPSYLTDEVYGALTNEGFLPKIPGTIHVRLIRPARRRRTSVQGVGPYLWAPDTDHELLEQLRPISVSGETDPADDTRGSPANRCRSTAAGSMCATGYSSMIMRGVSTGAGARSAGRPTISAETPSVAISMSSIQFAT